jgi:Predicted membrane protein
MDSYKITEKEYMILWIKKIIICTLSMIMLGLGAVLVVKSLLGNDPISVLYEGLGVFFKINMGIAANIINCILAVVVFFLDKKYIHIGTLIYALVLGSSISFWINLFNYFIIPDGEIWRVGLAIAGYLISFISVSAYIAIGIGIDPWTALALIISKKLQKPFGRIRIFIDTSALIIGYFLGGTVGIMTLISALIGGPTIQKLSEALDKLFSKMIKCSR